MTTIVAVQTEDDVLLAWDGRATRGNEKHQLADAKVWCRDGIVYAVSGLARFSDLLLVADLPEYDGSDARLWLIREFVPAVQKAVAESPNAAGLAGEDGDLTSALLVVVDCMAFSFDPLMSPMRTEAGIYTMGSGGDYARGAIMAGATPGEAVEIAASIDPFSGQPFYVSSACQLMMTEGKDSTEK